MAIRFDECDVRSMGRPAYGVRGIDLAKNDYVVGVAVTPKVHEPGDYRILAVTENGFGKRTDVEEYRLQSRGGKGVKNMAVTERIGSVSSIQLVDDGSELMVISQFGKIIRIDTKTDPRRRPRHPGRPPPQPRAGRQNSRRRHHPP